MTSIDHNSKSTQITEVGGILFQRHSNGQIWKYDPGAARWWWVSANDDLSAIAGSHKHLYKLRKNGDLQRYNDSTRKFEQLKRLDYAKYVFISNGVAYYIVDGNNGEYGIKKWTLPDESYLSYEELDKRYEQSQARVSELEREVIQLKNAKSSDDALVQKLREECEVAGKRNEDLAAELKNARDQAAKAETDLRKEIAQLQKDLTTAQAAEKKLAEELDEEKKKEHEEWKKHQEHDAEDHKALGAAHKALEECKANGTELEKQVDELKSEVAFGKEAINKLMEEAEEAEKKQKSTEDELGKCKAHGAEMEKKVDELNAQVASDKEAMGKLVDELNSQVASDKDAMDKLVDELAETEKKKALADAELKKARSDVLAKQETIDGQEKVIDGLKKEIEGQEELIAILRKQIGM